MTTFRASCVVGKLLVCMAVMMTSPVFAVGGNKGGLPVVQTLAQADSPASVVAAPALSITSAPLSWFAQARPIPDVQMALRVLADAASQGLNPQDYQVSVLTQEFALAQQHPVTPIKLAQLDESLTKALERYLSDLNQGRLSPKVLKHRFKVPLSEPFDASAYLLQARATNRLAEALASAEPRVPMYAAIRSMMNQYRTLGDHPAWQQALPAPSGRSLKPGQVYAGLPVLLDRLRALGDLAPSDQVALAYEGELVESVKQFQTRHGLEADGVVGAGTLAQLNVSPAQRVEQMALTLERLRWTPLLYGQRMIVVNVPEFNLRAYEQKESGRIALQLEMRVVVGRALDTRTPIFLEEMRFIEFSPYWNVPISIARAEILPRLRRDPDYFTQQGFEFVTRDGQVVTTLSETAIDAVQQGQWRIRQRPGPHNALGDIKFIFPNDQNIFLHHTPAPQLFSRARRDFSHGCIRIEAPVALAQFVLKNRPDWTAERIEAAMQGGKSRTLKLDEQIPVLIAYSTAVVKDNGRVYFFPDIYQQDAQLEQALRSARPTKP